MEGTFFWGGGGRDGHDASLFAKHFEKLRGEKHFRVWLLVWAVAGMGVAGEYIYPPPPPPPQKKKKRKNLKKGDGGQGGGSRCAPRLGGGRGRAFLPGLGAWGDALPPAALASTLSLSVGWEFQPKTGPGLLGSPRGEPLPSHVLFWMLPV